MKKALFFLAFIFIAFSANAQFNFGGQFSINFANERTTYSTGVTNDKEFAYLINLQPKFYWYLNEKMQLGGRVGFAFGRLTATLHKQWLNMDAVDSGEKLRAPLVTANWINSFTLPFGMRIDLSALLRSRGAEGNVFYRNVFCTAGFSLQQSFLVNRLIVSLGVDNLFCTHQEATFYRRASDMGLDGNDRFEHRTFKLSVKMSL